MCGYCRIILEKLGNDRKLIENENKPMVLEEIELKCPNCKQVYISKQQKVKRDD